MDLSGRPQPGCGEDVAPYALGALSPDDAHAFERHLAECELCRSDLETLRPVVHALGETPDPVEPPPELRRRLMAVVEQEAADRRGAAPARERRSWTSRLPRPLPALAVASVILVAGIMIGVVTSGEDPRTFRPATTPAGMSAQLELDDDGGQLVVHGMHALPEDRVMQVWLVHGPDGAPEPTDALFTPNRAGDASVAVPGDLDDVTRVMVSEEPRGGSRSPTTAPMLDFRVQSA